MRAKVFAVDCSIRNETICGATGFSRESRLCKYMRSFARLFPDSAHSFKLDEFATIGRKHFETLHLSPTLGPVLLFLEEVHPPVAASEVSPILKAIPHSRRRRNEMELLPSFDSVRCAK